MRFSLTSSEVLLRQFYLTYSKTGVTAASSMPAGATDASNCFTTSLNIKLVFAFGFCFDF